MKQINYNIYTNQLCPSLRSQSTTALNIRVDSTSRGLFSTSVFINRLPPCKQKSNTGKQFCSLKGGTDFSLPVRHP